MTSKRRRSTWNYRVVRSVERPPGQDEQVVLAIHEAYYRDADEPVSLTVDPVPVVGESLEELRDVLNRMLVALELDIVDE